MEKYKKVELRRHRHGPGAWIRQRWTFVVWLLVVILTATIYLNQSSLSSFTGLVETAFEPVAPLDTARLSSLEVILGDSVSAGDVLAQMDTTLIDAELAVEEATMLEAEGSISGYQQNILELSRRFEDAIRQAETEVQIARIEQSRDRAELEALRTEQQRREDLLGSRLISEMEASELRPRIAALEVAQSSGLDMITSLETVLAEAKNDAAEMMQWLRLDEEESISVAIQMKMEARSAILDNSLLERRQLLLTYTLRANRDGIVSRVLHAPGDVIPAGEEILRLVSPHATHIVGFLPEHHVYGLTIGDELAASRRLGTVKQNVPIRVETIAPEVESLPNRLSPIRGRPLRGRRVRFLILDEHDLLPGETVQIYRPTLGFLGRLFGKLRAGAGEGNPSDG